MTKAQRVEVQGKLGIAAQDALVAIGTRRRGKAANPITSPAVLSELESLGMIGPKGGLTDDGSDVRRCIVDARMNALFS